MIFLFFSSSLACLEPELRLFEVWEINVLKPLAMMMICRTRLSHQVLKKRTLNGHFSRPAETDPYVHSTNMAINAGENHVPARCVDVGRYGGQQGGGRLCGLWIYYQ